MQNGIFNEGLMIKINSLIENNVYLYFTVAIICYLVGGFDELIAILLILNIISFLLAIFQTIKQSNICYITSHLVKMSHSLIIIILSVLVDKTLNLDTSKILSLRNYVILYLSHREIVEIYLILQQQGAKVPFLFRKYVEIIKHKKDKESGEK